MPTMSENSKQIPIVEKVQSIDKKAVEALAIPLFLIAIANFVFLSGLSFLNPFDLLTLIIIDALTFYFITKQGFERLKTLLGMGFKLLFWIFLAMIFAFFLYQFFSLPPTTIIIVLLLMLISKK
jgi:hypothetical protein